MNPINRSVSSLTLALALTVGAGCSENTALVGRPALESTQADVVAEVTSVNTSSREIHLRTSDNRTQVAAYNSATRVVYRDREYPVSQLEVGDMVTVQLKRDSGGYSYADLIRVQESVQDRNQSRSGDAGRSKGIETLDGRVEQVDSRRNSFELSDQSRRTLFISLPDNAPRADMDHFRALRNGDYVRVEGRLIGRDRFELLSFLRDNR